ncbi:MAG: sulfite exporter TauE/SafE family protein [Eggerthellaceae bacterium]|nr:sulfite exporter TauE/SafE family protein [Eggerthellaceae bacterium]
MGIVIGAALCGVVVGILSGLLGVGGGTMMIPVFRLGFGLSALASTGTSLFSMIFTAAAGSITHIRNHTCLVPLGLLAGVCGACTSPLGVRLANMSPAWLVMLATGCVIAYSASTMLRKGLAMPKSGVKANASETKEALESRDASAAREANDASEAHEAAKESEAAARSAAEPAFIEAKDLTRRQYIIGAIAGLVAGVAGGYVGLGGGFLMVPIFVAGVGLPMKQTSGTSLLAVCILATTGAITQFVYGNVEVMAGLAMAFGSIPGAIIGANFIKKIPERTLRLMFGVFLLVLSVALVINEIIF